METHTILFPGRAADGVLVPVQVVAEDLGRSVAANNRKLSLMRLRRLNGLEYWNNRKKSEGVHTYRRYKVVVIYHDGGALPKRWIQEEVLTTGCCRHCCWDR